MFRVACATHKKVDDATSAFSTDIDWIQAELDLAF